MTSQREIMARFVSPDAARHAIAALGEHGVDGNDIESGETSAPLSTRATRSVDRRVAVHLVPRVLAGVAIGIVVGALVALLAGVVLAAVSDVTTQTAILSAELVGIWFGAALGGFVAFERTGNLSDAWPETFEHDDDTAVWVRVFSTDEERASIERVLAEHGARDVHVEPTDAGAARRAPRFRTR